ncbi:TIGR02099 family protein [Luteimonas sp. SX5]|uniref:TIGR02099 family protein n=1 Tax=Luteimonas galliterrae TaxID=2940486 RepID=A0ABT0ME47_9GAMM|nr:YhdP family protein [Luteimonas galliterrae]MCL1633140.1 TIGR02099 family protein [Luteimonas galliterrae]
MPTPWRHRLRLLRRGVWYALAAALVLMALVAGVTSQLLPLAERHPDKIAGWLSERAQRRVAFDHVETEWTRRGPLLRLDGLRIGDGADAVQIGEAEILVAQYAGLLPGRSFTELRVRGLELVLQRANDGRWSIRGLPGQQREGGDPLRTLENLGELQVIDAKLALVAPSLGIDARLPKVDMRVRVDGNRVRAGARAYARHPAAPVDAVIDFDRKNGDGRIYFAARQADLAAWSPLLRYAGASVEGGNGQAQAWAELRGHRVMTVTVDAAINRLALRGAAAAGAQAPRLQFDRLEARARWRVASGGWRLDAPRLRIGSGKAQQSLDDLVLAGGQRYAVVAGRVQIAPLLSVAALSDRLDPGLRRWLLAAKPAATLERVEVAGVRGGAMRAQGRIAGLAFAPVGDAPGLSGLSGDFIGDADGFALRLDPRSDFVFDWPRGFGVPHPAKLQGTLSGWREGAGWRVGSGDLYARGSDFGARMRGGLWFQGDGTRPWIDIAAQLDESPVPAAKGFWIKHQMSPATVKWLDAALVAGTVRNGNAVVSGDLDDWPFRDRNGLFQADADLAGATLKFQPDWPAAEAMDGKVSFVADGFTVDGKVTIAGVGIRKLHAGIPRFGKAELTVQAEGGDDASKLLDLLRQSPLRKEHGETLDNVAASGPANLTFGLWLPMHREAKGAKKIEGTVELAGAKLSEKRWQLAFDDVRGRARYGDAGFDADKLDVTQGGQPGKLTLRAGGFVRDARQAFEAELQSHVASDDLLDRDKSLAWLKPYLDGRSQWTVAVAIPRTAAGQKNPAPTRLQLRSNLVGTALDLPAPLAKAAAVPLAASIDAALPLDSGEVRVTLGNLLASRARSAGGRTGVRIVLGADAVTEAPPASGLVVSGRANTLDAIEWLSLAQADSGSGGEGLKLQQADVTANRLQLFGSAFANTRLQVTPATGGTRIRIDGPALAGTLLSPAAEGAPLTGDFERVYWRFAKSGAAPAANAAARAEPNKPGADIDPAKVPPLSFDIADLRLNEGQFGTATLRTRPVAAGMRIERLQTRAPKQRIDLDGDWFGRGAGARTRLGVTVDSEDMGALLAGAGFGKQVDGGKGRIRFDAQWPGAPSAFKLDALQGKLALSANDGRLLEVEPGAGRVLGLLSLAQLPRRLMLDFRDFFSKGFAFNKITGEIDFAAGHARSDDLVIDGPAAEIRIRGVADLRAQRFDQTIEVLPRAGNLLTVAGALAGGPVGAAIGAAANAVLKKPLGQMAAKTYRVTGPWKEPKVEVIGREQGRASRQPPPPAG